MFEEDRDYIVIAREEAYEIIRTYEHEWLHSNPPISGTSWETSGATALEHVTFSDDGLTLASGYQWNGSNIVSDRPSCMRASAVHDAWCQAMGRGVLQHSEENWDRGVEEYVAICSADGLTGFEAQIRAWFMKVWGELKFPDENGLWRVRGGRAGRRLRPPLRTR